MTNWEQRAAALADELIRQGKLTSAEWTKAVRAVPRHVLVPHYSEYNQATGRWEKVDTSRDGLDKIYSNSGLYTKIGADSEGAAPLSSTSTPGLMTRMLEMLDIRDGHRVLEIGTGTGYNAALLSHRLGDECVFSVDIDAELVDLARERLASLGYHPALAVADGADGMSKQAPFDRIIATCAVPAVPWAWVEQLTDGGLILVDLKRGIAAGNLILLRRHGKYAEGRFDSRWANFIPIRRPGDQPRQRPIRDRNLVPSRPTSLGDPPPWEQPTWWFLASLTMPRDILYGRALNTHGQSTDLFLEALDGSWVDIAPSGGDGQRLVWEGGGTLLWQLVERAYQVWLDHGQPSWQRFGLTVTEYSQYVWLDDIVEGPRWPIGG